MTDSPTQHRRRLSDVRLEGGAAVVRVQDVYPTTVEDLWSAVTDPERLARWIAVVEGDLRLHGEVRGRFTSDWEGTGRIEVCDAPRRLLVRWSDGTEIEARLSEEGAGARLVVEDRGLPADDAPFHAAGWHVHLEDLAAEVAHRPAEPWRPRWLALVPAYQGG